MVAEGVREGGARAAALTIVVREAGRHTRRSHGRKLSGSASPAGDHRNLSAMRDVRECVCGTGQKSPVERECVATKYKMQRVSRSTLLLPEAKSRPLVHHLPERIPCPNFPQITATGFLNAQRLTMTRWDRASFIRRRAVLTEAAGAPRRASATGARKRAPRNQSRRVLVLPTRESSASRLTVVSPQHDSSSATAAFPAGMSHERRIEPGTRAPCDPALSPQQHFGSGEGTSSEGLASKKPEGIQWKPA
jgi:hypothetical protein